MNGYATAQPLKLACRRSTNGRQTSERKFDMKQTPIESSAKPQLEITLKSEHRVSQHLPESIDAGFITLMQISKTPKPST